MYQWFDTHCHLDRFCNRAQSLSVIERARRSGVCRFLVPGVSGAPDKGFFSEEAEGLCFAWGIHPDFHSSDKSFIQTLSPAESPVAIGECGLDKRSRTDLNLQVELFTMQIQLAKRMGLPLIVHLVGHYQLAYDILLAQSPLPTIVMHSWSGSSEMACRFVGLGAKISLSWASIKSPEKILKLLNAVHISDLLLESDCPDMLPSFLNKNQNEPSVIPLYGAILAYYAEMEIAKLADMIYKNSLETFSDC